MKNRGLLLFQGVDAQSVTHSVRNHSSWDGWTRWLSPRVCTPGLHPGSAPRDRARARLGGPGVRLRRWSIVEIALVRQIKRKHLLCLRQRVKTGADEGRGGGLFTKASARNRIMDASWRVIRDHGEEGIDTPGW